MKPTLEQERAAGHRAGIPKDAAMKPTLEQERAADAWKRSQNQGKDYVNLAKGLPALIMNSGLMQVMAFLYEKSGGEKRNKQTYCAEMGDHLRSWLKNRFPQVFTSDDFKTFMQALMQETPPATYQHITAEAYAWLRWVRQIAAAVNA